MRTLTLCLLTLALSACAAQTPVRTAQNTPAGGQEELVCRRERPTGSAVSREVCKPRYVLAQETQSSRDTLERNQRNSAIIKYCEGCIAH